MRMRAATMKMAEEKKKKNVILKGSRHTVTVEESAPDIVVVRLEYSGFIFRGALLNLTNRGVPCGVNSLRLQSNLWTATASATNEGAKDKPPENSAAVNRFSYKTEPLEPLPDKCINPRPTKSNNRGYKEKTVRNIRLRPRQVLCAKCKSSCSDSPDSKKTSANSSTAKSPVKESLPPPAIPLKLNLRRPNPQSTKVTRQTKPAVIQRTSPIIKISFNNPQGQGTVVNIPRKVQNTENDGSDIETTDKIPDNSEPASSETASKRVKKSIRKAKERLQPYTTKHGKHKKHKHKHDKRLSQEMNPVVALSPLNLENIHNHNENIVTKSIENIVSKDMDTSKQIDKDNSDQVYRSPLRAKVIMKRERSASGSLHYVYEAHRISASPKVSEESCPKSLTVNLCNIEQGEKSDHEPDQKTNVDDEENIGPLMMRIQTKPVTKVILDDQRTICNGDIVWGKIHGFPWWPGRVEGITIGQKSDGSIIYQQAVVSWFGSSTKSDIDCSDLYNFLDDYQQKFNKRKRGPYRVAIKEATRHAKGLVSIEEETQKSEAPLDEVVMSETDCDVDVERVSRPNSTTPLLPGSPIDSHPSTVIPPGLGPTTPKTPPLPAPTTPLTPPRPSTPHTPPLPAESFTPPCHSPLPSSDTISHTPQTPPPCSPLNLDSEPPQPLGFSPKYSPVSMTSAKYSPMSSGRTPPGNNSPLSTPKYPTSPRYSPVPMTSLKYAPAPLSTPPLPTSTPEYTCTSRHPTISSLKYAPAPLSTYYSPAPMYSPVPMAPIQYPSTAVTSPYFSTTTSSVTSPYYSSLSVTSPFCSSTSTTNVAVTSSNYYNTGTTSSVASPSPYYAAAAQLTSQLASPYYSNVISPYYSPVPVTSQSPMPQSPAGPSSPKPLARYSPKYSPVTPTPSPLHSPVMASPVQCV